MRFAISKGRWTCFAYSRMTDGQKQEGIDIPLCVDLDGTLIRSSLLFEEVMRFLLHWPLGVWFPLPWLLKDRAQLKSVPTGAADPAPTPPLVTLEFLAWLEEEKAAGRKILLVTDSHKNARGRARNLFAFDEILSTEESCKLKGGTKVELLLERFGDKGFDYVSDSPSNQAVWPHARKTIPVFRTRQQSAAAEHKHDCAKLIYVRSASFLDWMKALRIHQWTKNFLIALPFLAGHHFHNIWQIFGLIVAFFAMSFCASGTYLWNDLLDLDCDRKHPRKKERLAASGRASPRIILIASIFLVSVGLISGVVMDPYFGLLLLTYIVATLSYSLHFKRVAIADIFMLTFLYLSRVIGGIIISDAKVSFWLFAFTFLLFLSLATAKRYVELQISIDRGDVGINGRGYIRDDLPTISGLGISSGVASCIVLSLYSNSSHVTDLYRYPEWLWGICVIALYWITRIWFVTHRGLMHDDPVVFALKDRGSWIMALSVLVCVLLAHPLIS